MQTRCAHSTFLMIIHRAGVWVTCTPVYLKCATCAPVHLQCLCGGHNHHPPMSTGWLSRVHSYHWMKKKTGLKYTQLLGCFNWHTWIKILLCRERRIFLVRSWCWMCHACVFLVTYIENMIYMYIHIIQYGSVFYFQFSVNQISLPIVEIKCVVKNKCI